MCTETESKERVAWGASDNLLLLWVKAESKGRIRQIGEYMLAQATYSEPGLADDDERLYAKIGTAMTEYADMPHMAAKASDGECSCLANLFFHMIFHTTLHQCARQVAAFIVQGFHGEEVEACMNAIARALVEYADETDEATVLTATAP